MISAEGLSASPRIHEMMMTGMMKRVAEAMDHRALSGYSALPADETEYETRAESVPGALPAELVTGKLSGIMTNTSAAANERSTVDRSDQRAAIPATRCPLRSFISEAVPEAKVMNTTGIAMNTPRLIRYDDTAERIEAVAANEPKSKEVARPIRTAAMYVIHVFIGKGYFTSIL